MGKDFIIYGKFRSGGKLFHPIDCKGGAMVFNRLYATLFSTKDEAERVMNHLVEKNPDMEFKLKKG